MQEVAVHPGTHTFTVFACGIRITVQAVTGASPPGHMTLLLPATQVNQSHGVQEVMRAPQSDVQPFGRPLVPGLDVNRMVLAGAGLPEPASGPGHLFSLRR